MVYSKIYSKFFKICNALGIFHFKIVEDGLFIDTQGGFKRLWVRITNVLIFFYLFYQFTMLIVASILGRVTKIQWFAQACWLILAFFPLPSMSLYARRAKKLCETLTRWMQLEKDIIATKVSDNPMDQKISPTFSAAIPPTEALEYDSFRRKDFCYKTQNHTFKRLMVMYAFFAYFTGFVVAVHNILTPDFGGYFTMLLDLKNPSNKIFIYISASYQFYMVSLCILHIGSMEMLIMGSVRSTRHCIETLSNLNSVSMERRTLCGRKKPKNDTLDVATIAENIEKRDATQYGSAQEMQVEEATDNYRRVEFIVESINDCFSGGFLAHQTLYLAMMCILIFVFLRSENNTFITSLFFTVYSVSFTVRICCLLPFLGKMGEDSEIFIYSWLEEIPKLLRGGKPYESAEVKLHACRILGINCGDYYDIQGSTILTFFSIVTTYLIILLQL